MPLTYGKGSVSITLDDGFEDLVRDVLERTLPGVVDRVEEGVERVYDQAVDRAPVRTGAFKRALGHEVQVAPDFSTIRGRVFDTVEYGPYVKSSKLPGSGSAFVELLRKPMESEAAAIIDDVREVLETTVGR